MRSPRNARVARCHSAMLVRSGWCRPHSAPAPLLIAAVAVLALAVALPSTAVASPKVKAPRAPTDVIAIAENGAADVSWSPPSADGGSPITGYVIFASTAQVGETSDLAYKVTGLANGKKYGIQVRAVNAKGEGRASANTRVTPMPDNFGNPKVVTVEGYSGDEMEPFVSPDGQYLFFNNSNAATDTNLYYAKRIDDTTFIYMGEIGGANSSALDAVPSMDSSGDFFFISTRSYSQTFSTIYEGKFSNGSLTSVALVPGVSKDTPGWVNFDADISPDGNTLYFDDGDYNQSGQLLSASLAIATKTQNGFTRLTKSDKILKKVNDPSALVYAPDISSDGLQLYYTRAPLPLGSAPPSIYVTTRATATSSFGTPTELSQLSGFVEAPALSPDGQGLYFHALIGGQYVIEFASRL